MAHSLARIEKFQETPPQINLLNHMNKFIIEKYFRTNYCRDRSIINMDL